MIAKLSVAALASVAALSTGCQKRVDAQRISIQNADAIWAGIGFCARTPEGLACWSSKEWNPTASGPTIVAGLKGVKDVVLGISDACALHDRGVSCFAPGEETSKAIAFEGPTQIVAVRVSSTLICVVDANGVSCGTRLREQAPKRRPELGKPRRLFVAESFSVLCGVYDDGTRCFEVKGQDDIGAGIVLPGVRDPKAVYVSTTGGHAYALDGDKLLYGEFDGTLVVGNSFAAKGPLDVEVGLKPFTGATAELKPYPGVGPARGMIVDSIFPVVLDDRGLVRLDAHANQFDAKRLPTSAVPSTLVGGRFGDLFTIENGALRQYAMARGKLVDVEVRGVTAATQIAPGADWTCALEKGGGIACVRSPPKL